MRLSPPLRPRHALQKQRIRIKNYLYQDLPAKPLRVVVPSKLSGEQRKLIEEVAELGGGLEPEVDRGFFERLRRAFGGE